MERLVYKEINVTLYWAYSVWVLYIIKPIVPDEGRPLTGSSTLNSLNSSFCFKYRFFGAVLNETCGDVHIIGGSYNLTIKDPDICVFSQTFYLSDHHTHGVLLNLLHKKCNKTNSDVPTFVSVMWFGYKNIICTTFKFL